MTQDFVVSLSSYIFLAGMLMLSASMFPSTRERFPRMMLYGFLVAVLSFIFVALAGFLLPQG